MSDTRDFSEGKGNPSDWSTEGWTAEWRRLGLEWWQYRVYDAKREIRTSGDAGWVDYKNPFFTNMTAEIKRVIQYYASVDAKNIAEIHKMSMDDIIKQLKR